MAVNRARQRLATVNHEPVEPFYQRIAYVFGFVMRRITKQDWGPIDGIPQTGGIIVCPNHISNFDPPAIGHFLMWSGRWPRFLAKVGIFKVPVVGWVAKNCGQIPVLRNTRRAGESLVLAAQALKAGKCLVIYPEGTRSDDPDLWPMTGRPGAARLALTTGAPVIPIGQWGAQEIMPGKQVTVPKLFPRKTMIVRVGAPVRLDDLAGPEPTREQINEATERIMAAITEIVAEIRGVPAPLDRYDVRAGKRIPRTNDTNEEQK